MSAVERIRTLDHTDPAVLCQQTETALIELVALLNKETTLLRAGRLTEASTFSAEKAQKSQDYVVLARAVKRVAPQLKISAPEHLENLKKRHEAFATQMAENLRVLATTRNVTKDLLADVAKTAGAQQKPQTYGNSGQVAAHAQPNNIQGISVNRAL